MGYSIDEAYFTDEGILIETAYYPESQLKIQKWFKETDTLIVSCSRCGKSTEILAEEVLDVLYCPTCDKSEQANEQPKKQNATFNVTLVPATITMPDGMKLFVYFPILLESLYGTDS